MNDEDEVDEREYRLIDCMGCLFAIIVGMIWLGVVAFAAQRGPL